MNLPLSLLLGSITAVIYTLRKAKLLSKNEDEKVSNSVKLTDDVKQNTQRPSKND